MPSPFHLDSGSPLYEHGLFRLAERGVERVREAGLALATRWRRSSTPWLAARDGASGLRDALARGAFDEAESRADRLFNRWEGLDDRRRARALPTVLEYLVAIGERERARSLASAHLGVLSHTARGATWLDTLGIREEPPLWLPNGTPNYVGIDRRLARATLSADELVAATMGDPRHVLIHPQLQLAAFSAYCLAGDRARAGAYLNRFFRRYSTLGCRVDGSGMNVLSAVRFDAPSRRVRGPLVSIIVSAYNAEHTIDYAIASLLAQTYESIEVLTCDDRSSDRTLDALRAHRDRDGRIRLFRSTENQGTYNVRNQMIAQARGELVTFHDADDFAVPTRVSQQVAAMSASHLSGCLSSWFRIEPSGRVVFFRDQAAVRLSIVSLMATRRCFEAVGPYRSARYGADLEYLEDIRARFGAASVRRLQAPTILGLWSEQSLTRTSGIEAFANGFRAPGRRLYSSLVARKHLQGTDRAEEDEISARLAESGNFIAPADVCEVP